MPIVFLVLVLFHGGLSALFSLLTLGMVSSTPSYSVEVLTGELLHICGHFAFGFLVFLPAFLLDRSRAWAWCVTSGLLAVAVDMDHLAAIAGLQTVGRASHSLGFMLFAGIAMGALAMVLPLRGLISPAVAALMGVLSVPVHIAFDAALGGGQMPLLAPFSLRLYAFSPFHGLVLQAACMALVAATLWVLARRQAAPSQSD